MDFALFLRYGKLKMLTDHLVLLFQNMDNLKYEIIAIIWICFPAGWLMSIVYLSCFHTGLQVWQHFFFRIKQVQSNSDSSKQSFTIRMGTSCLQTSMQISNMAFWLCLTRIWLRRTCSCSASSSSAGLLIFYRAAWSFPASSTTTAPCLQSNTVVFTALSPLVAIQLDKYQQLYRLGVKEFIRAQISARLEPCRWYLCQYCRTQKGNI